MTKASAILTRAREIITDPNHWTKGAYARDCMHAAVTVDCHSAWAYDLIGAFERAALELKVNNWDRYHSTAVAYLSDALWARYKGVYRSVVDFNDSMIPSHVDILELLDQAIATAKAEGV